MDKPTPGVINSYQISFCEPLEGLVWGFEQIPCEVHNAKGELEERYILPVKPGHTQDDLMRAYDHLSHGRWRAMQYLIFNRYPGSHHKADTYAYDGEGSIHHGDRPPIGLHPEA